MTAPYLPTSCAVNERYGPETAVVVLGCASGDHAELRSAARRRVIRAAEVALRHPQLVVLTAGGRRWSDVAEATAMARGLVRHGVDEARIVRELLSLTTRENARYGARLLRERAVARILLVTCDFHLERARACFQAEGFVVVGFAAPSPPLPFRRAVYRRLRESAARVLDRLL